MGVLAVNVEEIPRHNPRTTTGQKCSVGKLAPVFKSEQLLPGRPLRAIGLLPLRRKDEHDFPGCAQTLDFGGVKAEAGQIRPLAHSPQPLLSFSVSLAI